MIEMAMGIMVGCMPAVAALIRNRGLPFSHAFSSLYSNFESARVSTWSWLKENPKIRPRVHFNSSPSKNGDSALRDQRKGSSNWESGGYIELMEARQPRNWTCAALYVVASRWNRGDACLGGHVAFETELTSRRSYGPLHAFPAIHASGQDHSRLDHHGI